MTAASGADDDRSSSPPSQHEPPQNRAYLYQLPAREPRGRVNFTALPSPGPGSDGTLGSVSPLSYSTTVYRPTTYVDRVRALRFPGARPTEPKEMFRKKDFKRQEPTFPRESRMQKYMAKLEAEEDAEEGSAEGEEGGRKGREEDEPAPLNVGKRSKAGAAKVPGNADGVWWNEPKVAGGEKKRGSVHRRRSSKENGGRVIRSDATTGPTFIAKPTSPYPAPSTREPLEPRKKLPSSYMRTDEDDVGETSVAVPKKRKSVTLAEAEHGAFITQPSTPRLQHARLFTSMGNGVQNSMDRPLVPQLHLPPPREANNGYFSFPNYNPRPLPEPPANHPTPAYEFDIERGCELLGEDQSDWEDIEFDEGADGEEWERCEEPSP